MRMVMRLPMFTTCIPGLDSWSCGGVVWLMIEGKGLFCVVVVKSIHVSQPAGGDAAVATPSARCPKRIALTCRIT
jgi:hypothetical protein